MWKKIIEFKNAIIAVIFIATITLSASSYFDDRLNDYVMAAEFKQLKSEFYNYKDYQRLDYLDKRILHLEMIHGCAEQGCMPPKMSTVMYETYDGILKERLRLQEKININKKEN